MKRDEIRRLLPAVFRRASSDETPLGALLGAMELLHARTEDTLTTVDRFFDPLRAPDEFVPSLARWIDLDPELAMGTARLRSLVALGAELGRFRGTTRGLTAFLEAATGVTGFEVDDAVKGPDGNVRPFHLRVSCPKALEPYRELLEAMVRREKPAYATVEMLLFK
ncbi:MAG TPA: phage tail protein [Myxococcales bacterium]|jgi:phage tail-like protein